MKPEESFNDIFRVVSERIAFIHSLKPVDVFLEAVNLGDDIKKLARTIGFRWLVDSVPNLRTSFHFVIANELERCEISQLILSEPCLKEVEATRFEARRCKFPLPRLEISTRFENIHIGLAEIEPVDAGFFKKIIEHVSKFSAWLLL